MKTINRSPSIFTSRAMRVAEDARKAAGRVLRPGGALRSLPTVGQMMEPYQPDPRWRSYRMARPAMTYRAARRAEAKRLRKRLHRPDAP